MIAMPETPKRPQAFTWSEVDPLARAEPETRQANAALRDYAAMGPGRSLASLASRHQTDPKAAPTKRLRTLKDWSRRYAWQARVEAVDVAYSKRLAEAELTERLAARRKRIRTYEALRGVAVAALPHVSTTDARLADVARAIDVANRGLAAEYGDDSLTKALAMIGDLVGQEVLQNIAAVIAEGVAV